MGYTKPREFPNLARALGGWGKGENSVAAKKFAVGSEGAAERVLAKIKARFWLLQNRSIFLIPNKLLLVL